MSIPEEQAMAQEIIVALRTALAAIPDRAEVAFAELEGVVQTALRAVGAQSLERVVAAVGTGYVGPTRPCGCGQEQQTDHYATATWQTVVGAVTVRRAAYHCACCGETIIPLDQRWGWTAERTSPLLRSLLSLYCVHVPFADACTLWEKATGIVVSAQRAQLVSEALGIGFAQAQTAPAETDLLPLRAVADPPTRLYVGLDGIMSSTRERDDQGHVLWKEAKTAVFSTPLRAGAPGTGRRSRLRLMDQPPGPLIDVTDPDSHSYVVHLGPWSVFAQKVWQEATCRGIDQVRELVVLSDGAAWIAALRAEIFDGLPAQVTHIQGLRHAEEHLWAVARACLGDTAAAWIAAPLDDLVQGRVNALLAALQALTPPTAEVAHLILTTCTYYDTRRALMDYPRFRAQGYHIGSGLAESACKRVIGQRIKAPGMHWTTVGAQAIATLRAAYLSHRWHEVEAHSAA